MGLIAETVGVFGFLRDLFYACPIAVQLLIYAAFGGTAFLCIVRGLGR